MSNTGVAKPTLTYFNGRGRAEVPRMLLEDAGVDYDYVAIAYATWPEVQRQLTAAGKLPFGQVPLYEEPEGLTLVQSAAITRYLARKLGYNGTNAHEEALIDQAYEGVADTVTEFAKAFFAPQEQRAAATEKLKREVLPAHLTVYNKLLEKNGSNGFLVGSQLSYADVHLWLALTFVLERNPDVTTNSLLADFPAVKQLFDGINQRQHIKAYLDRDVYKASP